jgi:chromosomal replication initiation ATPase DnaA
MLRAVADYFGVPPTRLLSESRNPTIVNIRHILFMLDSVFLGRSTPEIGMFFQRDHTTVMHCFERYPQTMARLHRTSPETAMPELLFLLRILMRKEAETNGQRIPKFFDAK